MHKDVLRKFLVGLLSKESSGHDVYHGERVCANAFALARAEGGAYDAEVLYAASLLHDVLDHKLTRPEDLEMLRRDVRACLFEAGLSETQIAHVFAIWDNLGFKGASDRPFMPSLEGALVLDADRLDALGAIGAARCFAYGGKKGRLLYDPGEVAQVFSDASSYRAHEGSSLHHFDEKLFHLPSQMQTGAGRRVAEARCRFLRDFKERFLLEWEGKDL